MREVDITTRGYGADREITVTVGIVDQNGKYDAIVLSEAEAAVLMEKLRQTLYNNRR